MDYFILVSYYLGDSDDLKYNIIQKPILLRLSKDVIDFDCAYLIDNGYYIYLIIFNHIETAPKNFGFLEFGIIIFELAYFFS